MKANCPHQEAVERAASAGIWPEAVRTHLKACPDCHNIAEIARWMQTLATSGEVQDANIANAISRETRPLPGPELVWQRARLDKESGGQITNALELLQVGSAAAAPIALAAWVAFHWYSIAAYADQLLLDTWPQLLSVFHPLASLAPAALTVAALALGYPLLAND
jgi:hypothetical protein